MSDVLANGEIRQHRNIRLFLSNDNMARYNDLLGTDVENKTTLSRLLDSLFDSWLVEQELKLEFSKINSVNI